MTGKRRVILGAAHLGLGFTFVLLLALVLGYFVMLLWNLILPDILGARSVNYWQAVGLLILARLLVGGFHHGCHGRFGRRRRRLMGPDAEGEATLNDFVEHGKPPKEAL